VPLCGRQRWFETLFTRASELFSPAGSDPLTQVGTAALNTAMPPASVAVEGGLDCFAGGELRSFGRRDRDRLAGLRIAPLPLRALGDPKRPKAGRLLSDSGVVADGEGLAVTMGAGIG
jgi:hypothetical protein